MFVRSSALCAIATLLWTSAAQARVTDEQVQGAVKRYVEAIYKFQNDRGTWDPAGPAPKPTNKDDQASAVNFAVYGNNFGGTTALCTYALLVAGESYQNPRLRRAVEFLASNEHPFTGTYSVSFRNHCWSHLPPQFDPKLKMDTKWLVEAVGGGPKEGGYSYLSFAAFHKSPNLRGKLGYDNSNTQYGVLGVWEGAKRGFPVELGYWQNIGEHFVVTQREDGGWAYTTLGEEHKPTVTMTCAGLACLFIVQDYLYRDQFRKPGATRTHPLTAKIQKGLEWFEKNFAFVGGGYGMVAVERVGLASGYKYFGKHDWYAEGAEYLARINPPDAVNAAFGLIFLVRGRVPILANKLRIPEYDWNNRPRDLARLAEWVSDEVEQEMNWQVVDLTGKPEEWLDAPILYIASHEPLKLSPEDEQKIKRFIDLGGLVITSADNAEAAFTHSVQQLYQKLYPAYKLEKMSNDDEMLDLVFPIKANPVGALTLHNGVRHLAIHIPKDLSWTLHSSSHSDEKPWQFLTNVYSFVTERGEARPRLAEHFTPRSSAGGGPKVEVARVRYEGNWDPEPAAWERLANGRFNQKKADVTTKPVDLKDLPASGTKFAHMVGTGSVTLSPEQVAAIKAYVIGGGTILFENIGGRGRFTEAITRAMVEAFPGEPLRPLSSQSDLATGKSFGGADFGRVDYRKLTVLRAGRFHTPRLQAIGINDEPRVLISSEDLTFAMLDQPRWGIYGYSPASARQIMGNLVLRASRGPAPAPAANKTAAK